MPTSHRLTLKKANKAFKARHGTKSQVKARNKGKVERNTGKNKLIKTVTKTQRKNKAEQLRENKLAASIAKRKLYGSKIPRVITVVLLCSDISPTLMIELITNAPVSSPFTDFSAHKSVMKFVVPENNPLAILDAARVSDFVLFGLSAQEEVTEGEQLIRAIESQGVSNVACVVPNVPQDLKDKQKKLILGSLTSYFQHFFPEERVYSLPSDTAKVVHHLSSAVPKGVTWLKKRGYLLVDGVQILNNDEVAVEGVVRGTGMYVGQNVMVSGVGVFKIAAMEGQEPFEAPQIEEFDLGAPGADDEDEDIDIDEEDYEEQNEDDEQIEEDLDEDDLAIEGILKGENQIDVSNNNRDIEFNENYENNTQLEQFQEELQNPGLVEEFYLNPQESAIERLKKYKVTPLEVSSKAPNSLYISGYKNTSQRVFKYSDSIQGAGAGDKVRILLVPVQISHPERALEVFNSYNVRPLAIFGLLVHEEKKGVCHFSFKAWEDYTEPIASKSELIVQYGPHREVITPVFSRAGRPASDVHRYLKFANVDPLSVASAVAPVMFGGAPAIFFKQDGDRVTFVGLGLLESVDLRRVVAKRRLLVAQPFKIHKKVITLRYMFFNPQDVEHFKLVPLFTKSGAGGFIKESLGTHGYMKALFNRKLSSQDYVYMALYKGVDYRESSMY